MIYTRDSFLAFLRDNLDADIPIHWLRRDKDDAEANKLHENAVNVEFDQITSDLVSSVDVYIDVLNADETIASNWVVALTNVLSATCQTPRLDYTDPDNPTPVGGNVFWNRKFRFRPVRASELYSHYSCQLTLNHQ